MAVRKVVSHAALRTSLLILLTYLILISLGAVDSPRRKISKSLIPYHERKWNLTSTVRVRWSEDLNNTAAEVSVFESKRHDESRAAEDDLLQTKPASKWTDTSYSDPSSAVQHFTRVNNHLTTSPSLLILTMTKDSSSWGTSPDSGSRSSISFLSMLANSSLDLSTVSVTILTSSSSEYTSYTSSLSEPYPFARLHFILHPGYQGQPNPSTTSTERNTRHDETIQHARRAEMAKLRNYATLTSLSHEEKNILWLDADIFELSPGLIPAMIERMNATTHPQVGILTVRSILGDDDESDYDLNAWRGRRTRPMEEERERLRSDKGSWVANRAEGGRQMMDLVREYEERLSEGPVDEKGVFDPSKARFEDSWAENEGDDDDEVGAVEGLARLDAVGATVVMMKAALVRQGLVFSVGYMVGMDWGDEGWDGIESEGLCLQARTMGCSCYGMVERRWWSKHSTG